MAISVCDFVKTNINNLGTGKVVSIAGSIAVVEYFESIAKRQSFEISVERLRPFALEKQTRCYIYDEEKDSWLIGRIEGFWDSQYDVALPGDEGGYYNPSNIFVRCDMRVNDPTEVLCAKGHETAFFHNNRSKFVRNIVKQRAVSRGMTGLISSRIELYAHQVEIIRRVLEDPVQRYLLADEVGLGKTIETGVILRQFMLENPNDRILIIVPPQLCDQWREELEDKFGISEAKNRVLILGSDEIDLTISTSNLGMLIIDEAHHIAGKAFTSDLIDQHEFDFVKKLCHSAKSLLLLSATPVLNHEKQFLAMLHLLDPEYYNLDDIDTFRNKVEKRQETGRILISFMEGMDPFILKRNLQKIRSTFPEDSILENLIDQLEEMFTEKGIDELSCNRIIRIIRMHISDTYRLHRRMLRNRRESIEDIVLKARSLDCSASMISAECDLDDRIELVNNLLDEWRYEAFGQILELEESPPENNLHNERCLSNIFMILFLSSGSSLTFFEKVIRLRLHKEEFSELNDDLGVSNIKLLLETPFFNHEEEIEQELIRVLEKPSEDGDRIDLLLEILKRERSKKCLVFTSFTSVGEEIVKRLSQKLGNEKIVGYLKGMDPSDLIVNIKNFKNSSDCFVMVSDELGEEGRNLQVADVLIHFDLPWSINRIEQRIGRVDRIGRESTIHSYVFIGPDIEGSLYDAWYKVLAEGVGVFSSSVASLQFYLDEKLPLLNRILFENGAQGLCDNIEYIKKEIEMELGRVREQFALDEIDSLDKNAQDLYHSLISFEQDPKSIQQSLEPWIVKALRLERQIDSQYRIKYSAQNRALIPTTWCRNIMRNLQNYGTYDRTVAATTGHRLFRVGDSFINKLDEYIRWDDRGQVYAIWRYDLDWDSDEDTEWLGFRFDFITEADLGHLPNELTTQKGSSEALKRRADAFFPPIFETIFIDIDGNEVKDMELLTILSKPFDKRRDSNLTKDRLGIINYLIHPDLWPTQCTQASQRSEAFIRERPDFISLCKEKVTQAERGFEQRIQQLRLRNEWEKQSNNCQRTVSDKDVDLEETIGEALVRGIRNPQLIMDSVGFICVSGRQIESLIR